MAYSFVFGIDNPRTQTEVKTPELHLPIRDKLTEQEIQANRREIYEFFMYNVPDSNIRMDADGINPKIDKEYYGDLVDAAYARACEESDWYYDPALDEELDFSDHGEQANCRLMLECNTAACIAGWIGWIADLNCPSYFSWRQYVTHDGLFAHVAPQYPETSFGNIMYFSAEILGLSGKEANGLFFPDLLFPCEDCAQIDNEKHLKLCVDDEGMVPEDLESVDLSEIPASAARVALHNLVTKGTIEWPQVNRDEAVWRDGG